MHCIELGALRNWLKHWEMDDNQDEWGAIIYIIFLECPELFTLKLPYNKTI